MYQACLCVYIYHKGERSSRVRKHRESLAQCINVQRKTYVERSPPSWIYSKEKSRTFSSRVTRLQRVVSEAVLVYVMQYTDGS
jgi:hypothetical protein